MVFLPLNGRPLSPVKGNEMVLMGVSKLAIFWVVIELSI